MAIGEAPVQCLLSGAFDWSMIVWIWPAPARQLWGGKDPQSAIRACFPASRLQTLIHVTLA